MRAHSHPVHVPPGVRSCYEPARRYGLAAARSGIPTDGALRRAAYAHRMPSPGTRATSARTNDTPAITRIAAGVNGAPEGRDAVVLGAGLSGALGGELMLIAVHPDPLVVVPKDMNWSALEKDDEAMLRKTRDELAPDARLVVETDLSVSRALERVVRREHRDLLVVGSSRHAPDGHVRIGKRTRQILCHGTSPLAIAPRGMHVAKPLRLARVGVGYDGGPESEAALAYASLIGRVTGAELFVRGVVDDRLPRLAYLGLARVPGYDWEQLVESNVEVLGEAVGAAAAAAEPVGHADVVRGRPADRLAELDVDLLVIGSRRWGATSRLLLGSTGEALLQDVGRCPVIVVPRPADLGARAAA